ncbi:MAG: N-acetylmuramoyl-L-alanine amidase [Bacillota bacterium]
MDYVTDVSLLWPYGRSERALTDHIQIHHTVGDYSTPERWKALHERRIEENGWRGIEYSFGVNTQGAVFDGRGLEYKHGAVKNSLTKNADGIGAADRSVSIALIGDMREAGMPTEKQLAAAIRLTKDVMAVYNLPVSAVLGHREVPLSEGGTYPTACPVIDMDAFRKLVAATEAPDPEPVLPALYQYAGATFVNVRTGPGTAHPVISRLSRSGRCIVLALSNDWAEIILHEQTPMMRGWCISNYLRRMT